MEQSISSAFPFESKYINVFSSKMHYLQEDNPHEIGAVLESWAQKLA